MENTTPCCCNTKSLRLLAFVLFIWTEFSSMYNRGCVIFEDKDAMLFNNITPAYFVYQIIAIVTLTTSYILLSKMAAKQATAIVLRRTAIGILLLTLANLGIEYYKNEYPVSNITASLIPSLVFLVKTVLYLYLYGVIYRNNSEDKKGRQALMGMFVISYIVSTLWSAALPLHFNMQIFSVGQTLFSLAYIFFTYCFFTSPIFSGEKNYEPSPKGTYKFWNKFFTLYLALGIGGMLLLNLIILFIQG